MVHFFFGTVEFNLQTLFFGNGKRSTQPDIVSRKTEQAGDEGPVRAVALISLGKRTVDGNDGFLRFLL